MRESAEEGKLMLKAIRSHHLSLISDTIESDSKGENSHQEYQYREYFEFSNEIIGLNEDGQSSMAYIEEKF